jgi:flagellar FliL protein
MSEAKDEESTEATPEGNKEEPKKSKKKLIIIIAVPLTLIIIAAGLYFGGVFGHKKETAKDSAKTESSAEGKEGDAKDDGSKDSKEGKDGKDGKKEAPHETFVDLDPFIVNLNRGENQSSFLKMTVTLQLPNQDIAAGIKEKMPVIRDSFQVYLRELRPEDLQGSAGVDRLRSELLLRLNKTMYPAKITDILFKDFLVQ